MFPLDHGPRGANAHQRKGAAAGARDLAAEEIDVEIAAEGTAEHVLRGEGSGEGGLPHAHAESALRSAVGDLLPVHRNVGVVRHLGIGEHVHEDASGEFDGDARTGADAALGFGRESLAERFEGGFGVLEAQGEGIESALFRGLCVQAGDRDQAEEREGAEGTRDRRSDSA